MYISQNVLYCARLLNMKDTKWVTHFRQQGGCLSTSSISKEYLRTTFLPETGSLLYLTCLPWCSHWTICWRVKLSGSGLTSERKFSKKSRSYVSLNTMQCLHITTQKCCREASLDCIAVYAFTIGKIQVSADQVQTATRQDRVLSQAYCYTQQGWPFKVIEELKPYV